MNANVLDRRQTQTGEGWAGLVAKRAKATEPR